MAERPPEIGSRVESAHLPLATSAEVMVVGRTAPESATSTRWSHIKRLAGTRANVWTAVIGAGGLFLLGSTTGNPWIALIPPLIVLGILGSRIWGEATRLAARDFFTGFAVENRFNYSPAMTLIATTPLLAAGERRRCEHYLEGELRGVPGASVGLAHFTFETRENKYDRRKRPIAVMTPNQFTVAIVDLQRPAGAFPGVYLSRRGGLRSRYDWLDREGLMPATLANAELARDYELVARAGLDRGRLRSLMRPDLQAMFAQSTLRPGFEFEDGVLVTYAAGRLDRPEELNALIDLTAKLAGRLLEVGEPLRAVEPGSSHAPPPRLHSPFPPPPPATKPKVDQPTGLSAVPSIEPRATRGAARGSVPPPGS